MNRQQIITRASALLIAAMSAGPALAQVWEEIGTGSGTPPGIFALSNYDNTVVAGTEVSENPRISTAATFKTLLVFNSHHHVGAVQTNKTYALVHTGTEWQLYPAAAKGRVFADLETLTGSDPHVASSAQTLVASMTGAALFDVTYDAFAAAFAANDWQDRAGSLGAGGITDSPQFSNQVYEDSIAIDPQERVGLAYAQGSTSRRGIYYRRYDGTSWAGLGNSDTTPIAASTSATINNIYPTASFSNLVPVVAWTYVQSTINETVKVLQFDSGDSTWKGFGASATTGIGSGRHAKAVNLKGSTHFFVAFENRFTGALTVKEWNGTSFVNTGNIIGNSITTPLSPWGLSKIAAFDEVVRGEPKLANFDIALDSTAPSGRPVVVFRAESPALSGKYQIFASHCKSDGTWEALGDTGSALGLSGNDYTPSGTGSTFGNFHPSVIVGADNRPVVAWTFQNGAITTECVLVKRYDQPVAGISANAAKAAAYLVGLLDSSPQLLDAIEFTGDNIVDAADVARLPKTQQ